MKFDLAGKIHRTQLPFGHCLLPLYEAIVNSIQAIQAANRDKQGRIDIYIQRAPKLDFGVPDEDGQPGPVTAFTIVDNGEGFLPVNYEAFENAYTQIKENLGGKGVGRFLWLKAFDHAEIDSVYEEDGHLYRRTFRFSIAGNGPTEHNLEQVQKGESLTTVRLIGLKDQYADHCPKSLGVLATRIAEHCLEYFVLSSCPEIFMRDEDGAIICVTEEAGRSVILHREDGRVAITGVDFNVRNLLLDSARHPDHKVHYCANNRVVKTDNPGRYIPNLVGKVRDQEGQSFVYTAYVSSSYLDERVNLDRTGFSFQEESAQGSMDELGWATITEGIMSSARNYLHPYLAPISKAKTERVREYVDNKAPQYRYVLKCRPEVLDSIPPDAPEDRIEQELHHAYYGIKEEVREEAKAILARDPATVDNLAEYRKNMASFLEQVNEVGKSELVQYVVHRRLVLDLLKNALRVGQDGRYPNEDVVHRIIFPMHSSSDDLADWDEQNLWVIDERLTYHRFLASDIPLSQIGLVENDSLKRPDIVIFNRPFAFAEDSHAPQSIVIVEFKKPMRQDYSETDNPVTQVYEYIELIKSGKCKDRDGRPIVLPPGARFYCYIIVDMTPKLDLLLKQRAFSRTPDGDGYFTFNTNYNAYLEVITFGKLVEDARKRNRVLFDRLGLPSL